MGLFKKVKDILFDEEETQQIKITPEMRNETPKKEENVVQKPVQKVVEPVKEEKKTVSSEKEVFTSNSYPFLDFDEEEFDSVKPQVPKSVEQKTSQRPGSRYSNVLEYERKKKVEKRTV